MINQELLNQRLMRGALRGAVAIEETTPMSRCKGKLESGERCAIHAAPGKDRCMSCEARGAEFYDKIVKAPPAKVLRAHDLVEIKTKKKPGRPAKKGTLSEAEQELQEATKPGLCVSCAGEGTCDGFGTGQTLTECAAYLPAEQNIPENIPGGLPLSTLVIESDGVTDTIRTGLPSSVHAKVLAEAGSASVNEIGYEDEQEKAAQAGGPVLADHIADAGKLIDEQPVCLQCEGPVAGQDLFCQTCAPAEPQISPIAATLPQEAIAPCAESSSTATEARRGLAALLRAPSAPPSGLFIPFAPEEIFVLDESEVTPEIIRQFVLMGLEGKLQPVEVCDECR